MNEENQNQIFLPANLNSEIAALNETQKATSDIAVRLQSLYNVAYAEIIRLRQRCKDADRIRDALKNTMNEQREKIELLESELESYQGAENKTDSTSLRINHEAGKKDNSISDILNRMESAASNIHSEIEVPVIKTP